MDFVPKTDIPTSIRISGTAEIYFAGFISIDLDLTQVFPLSTNVTFSCPEGMSFAEYYIRDRKSTKSGMVFSEDWFSAPLVTTTCQENGEFERPDWEDLSCVIRKFQKSQSMSL